MSSLLRVAVAALGALLIVCAPAAAGTVVQAAPPTDGVTWVAHIVTDSTAYSEPGGSKSVGRVRARTPWSQSPTQLMVSDTATLAGGEQWIQVLLARKPNGSFGWVKADNTKLSITSWRVSIDVSERRLTIFKSGHAVRSSRVVVGGQTTPTPLGQFAVREIVKQPDAGGFSGPYILHLNANSERLKTFEGSDAVIGIHGRGGAALKDPLGSARSHGCVRIPNKVVKYLARYLVAGAPVAIVR